MTTMTQERCDTIARETVRAVSGNLTTRANVRVSRTGWVTDKRYDCLVGYVSRDENAAGQPIWKAHAGDVGSFAFKREDAVATVIELYNMQEKARAYDLLARVVTR